MVYLTWIIKPFNINYAVWLVLMQVWSGSLGQPLAHVGDKSNGSAVCVAFHPDAQQVLAGFHSGHLRLYDITTGMIISDGYEHIFR